MENSNISPVTESEVMDFAQRVCTAIVSHSKQQAEIDALRTTLDQSLSERDYLRGENTRLSASIGESNTLADAYAKERDAAHTELGATRSSLEFFRDTMVIRDVEVSELGQEVNRLTTALDQARHDAEANGAEADNLSKKLSEALMQRDDWMFKANSASAERDKAKADLNKLQDTFKTVFGHMQDAAPKPEPTPETPKPDPVNISIREWPDGSISTEPNKPETDATPDKVGHSTTGEPTKNW